MADPLLLSARQTLARAIVNDVLAAKTTVQADRVVEQYLSNAHADQQTALQGIEVDMRKCADGLRMYHAWAATQMSTFADRLARLGQAEP